jgi:hypothetical protein
MEIISGQKLPASEQPLIARNLSRRNFLRFAGITGASAALIITGCGKDDSNDMLTDGVNLGSGDTGILNYAFALEQLEAAFYTRVAESPYGNISALERQYFEEIRDHEIAHRELFKKALGNNAIGNLEVDFSSVNFSNRDSVLATAKAFEDLGVSAYNGAGKLLTNPDYLLLAGKIVSVEARHAALVRDLIANGSFADNTIVDANGLDRSLNPSEVLMAAAPFVKTKINASGLPTN